MSKKEVLSGWGRFPKIESEVSVPAWSEDMAKFRGDRLHTPRGSGLSYGDSALGDAVTCFSGLKRFLTFDKTGGSVTVEAGLTLDELLRVVVPHGWFLPVSPGTKYVTVGGAVASDVHGKNHHTEGCISEFVIEMVLILGNGDLVSCSRQHNQDLFHATCGGMGLTGLIIEVKVALKPISSSMMKLTDIKTGNLEETINVFLEHGSFTYSVAWIDCLAKGASSGRSIVTLGEHATEGALNLHGAPVFSVPFPAPSCLVNHWSMKAFNSLYYERFRNHRRVRESHFDQFFYPLDFVRNWNRLYGKTGFLQYQFVIPMYCGKEGVTAVLKEISARGEGSFLAVLKAFGAQNQNHLSFPLEGITLALDFKSRPEIFKFLDRLDALVLDFGGRIYLTKDARMSQQTFRKSYPRWSEFMEIRSRYFATDRFTSNQAKRLGLVP